MEQGTRNKEQGMRNMENKMIRGKIVNSKL